MLVQVPFELEFASANARGLVPMHLGQTHGAIHEFYLSNSLPLSPARSAIMASQALDFSNRGADGNGFDVGDATENPEIHALRVVVSERKVKPLSNEVPLSCGV